METIGNQQDEERGEYQATYMKTQFREINGITSWPNAP
jgi:hypothetical protein